MVKESDMTNGQQLGDHVKYLVDKYNSRMVKEPDMSELPKRATNHLYIDESGVHTRANEQQVGGAHYAVKAIQPWDYIIDNNLGYLEGNIVKYVSRWKDKGGIEDLKKAQHYLQKLIEVTEKSNG
jgi:hypothetical protein